MLKAVFKAVIFEVRVGGNRNPQSLAEAISNLRDIIERNFEPNYYSRKNLLVWLPIFEEMLLNARTRRSLAKLDRAAVSEVAFAAAEVARFRKLSIDSGAVASGILAVLDGLWLRWCLSGRRDTRRELDAALRFLEASLGPLDSP